jgi:hypothetical protein
VTGGGWGGGTVGRGGGKRQVVQDMLAELAANPLGQIGFGAWSEYVLFVVEGAHRWACCSCRSFDVVVCWQSA